MKWSDDQRSDFKEKKNPRLEPEIAESGSWTFVQRMWTKYKILIFSYLVAELCAENHSLSQREVDPGPYFTRNHTIFEGARHKRAIFRGQYCRLFGCCEDRDDACVTPFYEVNALCYCDSFCERENPDCCPDYNSFCHEEKEWLPPKQPLDLEGRFWEGAWTFS